MAIQKRKQESEKRKRLKTSTGVEHAVAPVESEEVAVQRESTYGGNGNTQLIVDIADTSQNTSSPVETLVYGSRRPGLYLIINITDVQSYRTEVSGHVPGESGEQNAEEENGSSVPLSRLLNNLLGTVFLFRRQESPEGDTTSQENDRSVYFDIRDLVVGIFSALNGGSSKAFRRTVKRRDMEKIPTARYSSNERNVCSICLSAFSRDEELRLLRCKHMFHRVCVDPWLLQSSDTCPMCREPVLF